MLFTRRAMLWFAAAIVLGGSLTTTSFAQKPVKGGGGTSDPPPPPPVRYQVIWSGLFENDPSIDVQATDVNNQGTVVGALHYAGGPRKAFMWTAIAGIQTIDELAVATPAIVQGWTAREIGDINTLGRIAGEAWHIDHGFRPFVYDATLNPVFQIVPIEANNGFGINDYGDLAFNFSGQTGVGQSYIYEYDSGALFGYQNPAGILPIPISGARAKDINNSGQVIGTLTDGVSGIGAFRYSPGELPQVELWYSDTTMLNSAFEINDDGWFVGRWGSGTNGFRYDDGETNPDTGWTEVRLASSLTINNRGDVVCNGARTYFTDDPAKPITSRGLFSLNDLVDPTDAKWFGGNIRILTLRDLNDPNSATDPDNTGFGQICGWAEFGSGKGKNAQTWTESFILVPVAVPE